MATLYTPQSQAGIMSFYDAPSKGPKVSDLVVLIAIVVFAIILIIVNHFAAV